MLAKQVWRLHTKPESLIARVFKARYFPHSDILQANIGSSPSYAWRSLHQALWVLNKGCCWKVGNGTSINIWDDRWLPFQNGFKVLTKAPTTQNVRFMKDLILKNPPRWNQELIGQLFMPFEEIQIL